ncbi:MAG TPA: cupin, partial [Alcanivorax sp.]|nr:cupin [Alcanivorax sp.]
MSNLKVFRDGHPEQPEQIINDKLAMAEELGRVGIRYEQWQAVGA